MGSAAISAFLALASHDDRRTLTYLNSALGGLALGLGAAGLVLPVWLCVVMLSSIKMLFFLASDLAVSAEPKSRKTGIGLVAVGSVAMAGLGLITVQWLPPAQVWKYTAIELAWAATAVAGLALAYRLWRAFSPQFSKATGVSPSQPGPVSQPQHIVAWLLGGLLVFEIVDFKDAMGLVARAAHLAFPTLPTWPELLLQALGSPLLWGMALFSLAAWAHQRRLEVGYIDETEGLSSERLDVADRLVTATAKLTMKSAGKTREIIEHGLDQTLHGLARLALAWGKAGQRLHTGRLRVNLIWVALSLALAAAVALAAWR